MVSPKIIRFLKTTILPQAIQMFEAVQPLKGLGFELKGDELSLNIPGFSAIPGFQRSLMVAALEAALNYYLMSLGVGITLSFHGSRVYGDLYYPWGEVDLLGGLI
jgi:hypothetical protein